MRKSGKSTGRKVNGILLLDKPVGSTSNDVLQKVKSIYKAKKAGHTGSLDKAASGLLPICFGEATKFSGFLLDADKHYRAVCRLGIQTNTGDADGEIIEKKPAPELSRREIESTLDKFKGETLQTPPMFSALKHRGQRLYKLACQGIEVDRRPRRISIYSIELLNFTHDEFEIAIRCSKGTYIRTLAEDIGRELGCGAHVKTLRRTGAGPFEHEKMITVDALENIAETGLVNLDSELLCIDSVLQDLPAINLVASMSYSLCQGQAIMAPHTPAGGMLRIYTENHRFLGVGEVLDDGRIAPKRLLAR